MSAVVRLGDICSGHGCYPPRPNDEASEDVFVNGDGVHRLGDHWIVHCCDGDCHDGEADEGSDTVFVNGLPVVRIGDAVSCGSIAAQGSFNTFFG